MGFIYIFKRGDCVKHNIEVYKIGRTNSKLNINGILTERLGGYPKGTKQCAVYEVEHEKIAECFVLKHLEINFDKATEYGAEYFRCSLDELQEVVEVLIDCHRHTIEKVQASRNSEEVEGVEHSEKGVEDANSESSVTEEVFVKPATFSCDRCHETFRYASHLKRHMEKKKQCEKKEKVFYCCFCQKPLQTNKQLSQHEKHCHFRNDGVRLMELQLGIKAKHTFNLCECRFCHKNIAKHTAFRHEKSCKEKAAYAQTLENRIALT